VNRRELAEFLKDRRRRVQPQDVGLEAGPRRRTPGLRREEVARLAGMSVDYYVRLEQARGPHPSRQILGAMARALRLTDDERDYIYNLAGERPSPPAGPPQEVPAAILHLLRRMDDTPAYVLDAKFDVLAWNPLAAALITDFTRLRPRDRNIVRRLFGGDPDPAALEGGDYWGFCQDAVADLRAASARYPGDPGLRGLVEEMRACSRAFRTLWERREVRTPRTSCKTVNNPLVGRVDLHCDVLNVPDRDQKVILYTAAPGTPSYEALKLLRVVGVQDMSVDSLDV
jgi:transcriptional regulator with XRE-family HTH domain